MISNTIRELGKEATDINNRRQLQNEYYDFVSVTISELIYPSLAQEYDHRISFEPRNEDVKYFPVSALEIANYQTYEEVHQMRYLSANNKLNKSYVERKVIDYVKNNCISQINKSLEQKAKIVILNGTRTAKGFRR
ncbi:MAG: hypothetical protein WAM14_06940 [Candidatus Nitrosopolaris sp.]